jgi:hypothetical protein
VYPFTLIRRISESDRPHGSLPLPPVVTQVAAKVSNIEQLGDK